MVSLLCLSVFESSSREWNDNSEPFFGSKRMKKMRNVVYQRINKDKCLQPVGTTIPTWNSRTTRTSSLIREEQLKMSISRWSPIDKAKWQRTKRSVKTRSHLLSFHFNRSIPSEFVPFFICLWTDRLRKRPKICSLEWSFLDERVRASRMFDLICVGRSKAKAIRSSPEWTISKRSTKRNNWLRTEMTATTTICSSFSCWSCFSPFDDCRYHAWTCSEHNQSFSSEESSCRTSDCFDRRMVDVAHLPEGFALSSSLSLLLFNTRLSLLFTENAWRFDLISIRTTTNQRSHLIRDIQHLCSAIGERRRRRRHSFFHCLELWSGKDERRHC